ncbi:MAG TPA: hypothetical protein VGS62_09805 [Streptosporangiaceae bacterium]|nr:hypothetical protein [Streptosporangiaceae bacterium]
MLADDRANMMRLAQFRSAHPRWRIGYDDDHRYWQAWLPAPDGGTVRTAYLLRDLLDKLDPPDSG